MLAHVAAWYILGIGTLGLIAIIGGNGTPASRVVSTLPQLPIPAFAVFYLAGWCG